MSVSTHSFSPSGRAVDGRVSKYLRYIRGTYSSYDLVAFFFELDGVRIPRSPIFVDVPGVEVSKISTLMLAKSSGVGSQASV